MGRQPESERMVSGENGCNGSQRIDQSREKRIYVIGSDVKPRADRIAKIGVFVAVVVRAREVVGAGQRDQRRGERLLRKKCRRRFQFGIRLRVKHVAKDKKRRSHDTRKSYENCLAGGKVETWARKLALVKEEDEDEEARDQPVWVGKWARADRPRLGEAEHEARRR